MNERGEAGKKVLVIEDDGVVRKTVACYLEDSGFAVFEAENGREGLEVFSREDPDIVLLDLRMPELHGIQVLAQIREKTPHTPVIIISGAGSIRDVVEALRLGAWDYLTKPIPDLGILEHAVRKSMERAALLKEKERHREHLEEEIARRTEELERELTQRRAAEERAEESVVKLKRVLDEIVQTLAGVVEIKDPYTSGHQRRVVQLAMLIAQELGLPKDRVEAIRVAGLLHDIGKIHVPAEILSKPGKLIDPERKLIQTHCQVGHDLLRGISFEWPVAEIVLQHHERQDGSGYPQGLRGEEILPEARILGVSDVVEALSSHRPYRPAFGIEYALAEIASLANSAYDPEVVSACLTLFRDKGFEFR